MSQKTEEKTLDKFEQELIEKTKKLKECQASKGVTSCLKCELVIGCEIRNEYVDAVYLSMNKGQGGGFEF